MRTLYPIRHILFLLLLCCSTGLTKAQLQCENDTSYLRSLIDLKTGLYLGYQGGLYPDGLNTMPYPHYADGMNISRQIVPLNADGALDLADGKVGFICLGASTAGNAFNHFKTVCEADTTVNPCIKFANCAVGAKGLEVMIDTVEDAWYWDDEVMPDLDYAGITRYQVQVAWVMVTSRIDTILIWPYQPQEVANKYEALMQVLLVKFPNLKQVYLSGFNYGGYADPTKEFYDMIMEPSSYWNNWSVKFLIERQLDGDPSLKYKAPDRVAPWLGWGPHLWADGLRDNVTDHLRWVCEADYKPDGGGYHMSNSGKDKMGKLIYDFFINSPIAADWFKYGARWVSCDPDFRTEAPQTEPTIRISPNPAGSNAMLVLDHWADLPVEVDVYNGIGQPVQHINFCPSNSYMAYPVSLDGLPAGTYHIVARQTGLQVMALTFLKQ